MKKTIVKAHNCLIVERDYKLLRFLWKWKAVSTSALALKFFPIWNPISAYRRLLYLAEDGYIKAVPAGGRERCAVWTLADRGFKLIQPNLGEMVQTGYKSENLNHDYISSAFHLGEWLTYQPPGTQNYSEQQLRRYPAEAWPEWIPQSKAHRPDGFSLYFKDELPVVVAFETEISVKGRKRFERVVSYYDAEKSISFVLWLVDSKKTARAIRKSFEHFFMQYQDKHQFVTLSDYKKLGVDAKFFSGKFEGQTLKELLPHTGSTVAAQCQHKHAALSLFEIRKRPKISES